MFKREYVLLIAILIVLTIFVILFRKETMITMPPQELARNYIRADIPYSEYVKENPKTKITPVQYILLSRTL